MAEPKKRTNKSKTGMRRMHHKANMPSINFCSNCHEPMIRHQVCTFCGFYKGKKILEVNDKKDKIEEKVEDKKEESKKAPKTK